MIRILLSVLGLLIATTVSAVANNHTVRIAQVDATSFPTVDVYVAVTDRSGQFVRDLGVADFRVWEDGALVRPEEVVAADELTVVLVIDRSGSMANSGKIEAAKRAALAYLEALRPRDKVALIDFELSVNTGRGLDEDRATVSNRIASLRAGGGTGLFDATYRALELLRAVKGRKAALVLTDGMDSGRGKTIDQVLEAAAKDATSIFTIGLGTAGFGGDIDEGVLQTMARSTNGEYLHAPGPDQLAALYQRIGRQLSSEYRVRYQSLRPVKDGTRRAVEASVVVGGTEQSASSSYLTTGVLGAGATNWPLFVALLLVLLLLLHPGGLPALLDGRPLSLGLALQPKSLSQATTALAGPAAVPPGSSPRTEATPPSRGQPGRALPELSSSPSRAASSPARPAKLIDATGRIHTLAQPSTTVGRSGCDVAFVDSSVALRQARIDFVGGRFVLVDLAGNTRVNDAAPPAEGVALSDGDEITLGRRRLSFRV